MIWHVAEDSDQQILKFYWYDIQVYRSTGLPGMLVL